MKKSVLRNCVSAAAVVAAGLFAVPAFAQSAAAPAAADNETEADTLDTIVVTASLGDRTKLNTSASITSIDSESIKQFNATSTAELYRLIPGIQVPGTQGDGGNSNIGVRGLRTPTGGSPFVQVQEDGLPTVLFGDIQFGNNDYWTHPMATDERIESVVGGTASTLASQAIGAVINHISYTGRNDGGFVELEKGVNYDYTKVNFRLGSSLNDSTYFNVGGYYDIGHGITHAAYNVSNSYAIKGNLTKELGDNRGYIRFLFKLADTQEPSYNGCVSSATLSGTKASGIGPSALCDARNQAPGYSALNSGTLFSDVSGNIARQPLDGIRTNEKWGQLQLHYDLGGGLTIDDNARVARMSGKFEVQFYGAGLTSGAIGAGQSLIYANGPKAGQVFTGTYVSASAAVHTNMNHMDHVANDLALSYKGGSDSFKYNLKVGYQYYSQRIAEDWHSNNSINEATGKSPAQLDLVSGLNGTGTLLSASGQTGFNAGWNQQFDATFTDNAPYANLSLDIGNLNLDASIREEFFQGSGSAQGSSGAAIRNVTVTQTDPRTGAVVNTVLPLLGYDGPVNAINFSENATNWSFGALYKVTGGLSVYARASHGTRFNADRLTNNSPSYFNPDGSLSTSGLASSKFPVTQYELGLKSRGDLAGGRYTVQLTGFYSKYSISSFEINPIVCAPATTCTVSGNYKDKGLEFFTTYRNHGLSLIFSATYDDSKVQGNKTQPFAKSTNIPNLTYSGLVSYDVNSRGSIGISVDGQSSVLGGGNITYAGSSVFGAFIKVTPVKNIEFGLQAYNLFNSYATQGPAGFVGGSGNTLVNAGVAQGRGIKASVKVSF
jgi:outer membrane receptor protein involved in Fe transport